MNIYQQISRNKAKTILFIVLFIGVILALGFFVGQIYGLGYYALIPAGIIAFFASLIGYYGSDKVALSAAGAQAVKKSDQPDLYNLVENLAITTGLPVPHIYLIPDSAPNAFATGRDPAHASVAVTTGLVEKLERVELEGVIAHEMSHIKNYDMRLMTMVVVFVGVIILIANFAWRFGFLTGGRRSRSSSGQAGTIIFLIGLAFLILSPLIAKLIQMAISRRREFLADATAALTTRFPEGLARALEKIKNDPQGLTRTSKAIAHLYIAEPKKNRGAFLAGLFSTHPPLEERIKRLREM